MCAIVLENSPSLKMPSLAAADLLQLLLLVLLPLPNVTSDTRNIPSLILDTDMDFDVDDVGALCLAHSLQVKQFILSETANFYPLLCLICCWALENLFNYN